MLHKRGERVRFRLHIPYKYHSKVQVKKVPSEYFETILSRHHQRIKNMKNLLSITQFLLLIGVSSSVPTEDCGPQNCKTNAVFNLKDIEFSANYIYSTPAHLAVSGGSISFNLTNPAVPYTTSCSASCHDYPGVYCAGWEVWNCTTPAGAPAVASASFSFEDAGFFNVTQIWGCGTDTIKGVGNGRASLNCTNDVWTNPNWTPGSFYQTSTTTCQPAELQITPTITTV